MTADAALHLRYGVEGAGPDVVFLHGLGADRHQAERALAGLRGYRVTTIDLPGH